MKAATEGIGLQSILRDLALEASVEVYVDSSTAKSIASSWIGVGKVRHIHARMLWIQEVCDGKVKLTRVSGCHNPDVLSRPMSLSEVKSKLQSVGIEVLSGERRWADTHP